MKYFQPFNEEQLESLNHSVQTEKWALEAY